MAWLLRPLPAREPEIDPLEACSRALAAAASHLEQVPPLHARAGSLATAVSNIANRIEKIAAGRPRAPTVDEVAERIKARRDDAFKQILQHTAEARAKLDADRAEFSAWADQLGPVLGAELRRRLDAMLGVAP